VNTTSIISVIVVGAVIQLAGIQMVGRRLSDIRRGLTAAIRKLRGKELRSVSVSATARWRVHESEPLRLEVLRREDLRDDVDELKRQLTEVLDHFSEMATRERDARSKLAIEVRDGEQKAERARMELTNLIEQQGKAPVLGLAIVAVGMVVSTAAAVLGALA